jgi:hypothetical protein
MRQPILSTLALVAGTMLLHPREAHAQGEPPPRSADEAEADAADAEESPSRPPPKGKGVIWGVVKGGASKETLVEAQVTVLTGPVKKKALTDVDGRYRLELPPGVYEVRSFYELHKAKRVQNLQVVEGKVLQIDIDLDVDQKAEEIVEAVVADIERGSVATQLDLRKKSTVSSDSVGAADIARTPDRNAADTAKRIVGTSVVDGKFVFVRGLGERYTNALLDGVPVPSPEPDRVAVPLDMFPALIISDITVLKTFAPDMPGDFAGGSVRIHTRDLPARFKFQATLGVGANTESTFAKRWTYHGGNLDWLGLDDGARRLPRGVPAAKLPEQIPDPQPGNPFNQIDNPAVKEAGRQFASSFEAVRTLNLPNGSGSAAVGDSIPIGKLGKVGVLGYQAAVSYSRRFQNRTQELMRVYTADSLRDPAHTPETDVRADTGIDLVSWSTLGKVAFSRGKDHTVSVLGMFSVNSNMEARKLSGAIAKSSFNEETRLRFQSRQLAFAQLNGEHRMGGKLGGTLDYSGSVSRAALDDPDMRTLLYTRPLVNASGPLLWADNQRGAEHFYGFQVENGYSAGVNWTQPLTKSETMPASVKFGGFLSLKRRNFAVRRFNFRPINAARDAALFAGSPDGFLGSEGVDRGITRYEDNTQSTDAYRAKADVLATYVMADLALTPRLRTVVGPRLEWSKQTIDSFSLYDSTISISSALDRFDVLPAAHLIYKATSISNVRFSVTRTVGRPQLRELAPFVFTEFNGARDSFGNPNLDRTQITNMDLRFELFPGANEVLAVTTFFKHFDKPIERIILPTNIGTDSFANAPNGVNGGIEFEARKGLGFIHKALGEFTLMGNLTLVVSRVRLDPIVAATLTSKERPMAGQSPYVFNAALDWAHEKTKTRVRLLYNVFGPRLFAVGSAPIPDIYEQPRHTLDFTAAQGLGEHFDLKLSAENILNTPYVFTHGFSPGVQEPLVTQQYRLGCNVWLALTYTN